jgi:D-3-phosphoglycerate dehydrogenase / 2-oxoglutarate reductase
MEVIDLEYARAKGIASFSSPEGNCNAVGEHAIGMLLALIRRIVWSNIEMKDHTWKRDENRGTELEGKTVGIIGFGHTGRAFAKKLQGFDVNICVYDKYNTQGLPGHVHNCPDLENLLEQADIVSFHVPLQADTHHYFNDAFLRGMRKPFILINTSRGPVVDTVALYHGLTTGKVLGACLDVFEQEPVSALKGEPAKALGEMMEMPNVVMTPHIAGYTFEALYKMSKTLLDKLSAL